MAIGVIIGIFALAFILPFFLLVNDPILSDYTWIISLTGLIVAVLLVSTFLLGRLFIHRLFLSKQKLRIASTLILSVIIPSCIIFLIGLSTNLPVPKSPTDQAVAAASLQATVGDMAAFLIELSHPEHLSVDIAQQLQTSQVRLANDLSWGLGPGIYHSVQGDVLWQWGQHIDFQSIMMIYPDHDIGVVVCTNNDLLNPDVALEIAQRAIGGQIETIRRAIHLEYNYSGEG
jgi:hypothetical protein